MLTHLSFEYQRTALSRSAEPVNRKKTKNNIFLESDSNHLQLQETLKLIIPELALLLKLMVTHLMVSLLKVTCKSRGNLSIPIEKPTRK